LLSYLHVTSYRNMLTDAAIQAMRAQDNPAFIGPVRETLRERESYFTTAGFSRGLENLAFLARHEEEKESLREFFLGYVNSKKPRIQLAAINALGVLGDVKAIAPLEKFTAGPKENAERIAAEKALISLRETKKPSVELGTLRSEVLTLQKENKELRKEFEALKKKLESNADASTPKTAKSKGPKR
jgi:HEAT repeat protein